MQMPIWPEAAPDAKPAVGSEVSRWWPAGRGGFTLGNVSQPTMTVYSPVGKNTSAAVVGDGLNWWETWLGTIGMISE
jgi:hypothetical protein